ncbi:hypothetical protein V1525DRAFT_409796 [Lipomyces kononenkoae]|uniref:Uncharacterized protein n=1 Tax=Lipomyces kononenkoae TaxID=34357 RepID=A0ACC3SVX3_LIPKO
MRSACILPADLVDELRSLPNYFFDLESAYNTSYDSWHVLGKHVTVTETPILARISPSARALRLEQEFAIVRHMMKLDPTSARIIRAFEFFHLQKTKAVVSIFEYLGENSLSEFSAVMTDHQNGEEQNDDGDGDDDDGDDIGSPSDATITGDIAVQPKRIMTLPQFLDFAIGACESLELLHQSHNIVHGEVRDDAFFYNASTRIVKIMQFGSSTRIVQSSIADSTIQDIVDNSALDYKYVYLSPEQTGRASSCVDHRTDIYSLGIVFFSVLTSHLPFYGSAMDVIHDILHSPVPSIESYRPDLPSVIDSIIQKMTAKQSSQRYRSALGLKHDLLEVQRLVRTGDGNVLEDFELGTKDVSSIFILPTETIGRDAERDQVISIVRKFVKHRRAASDLATIHSKRLHSTTHHSDSFAFSTDSKTLSSPSSSPSVTSVDMMSSRASQAYSGNGDSRRSHRQDRTEVIVIRGHPGIGKTTFVTSLRAPIRKYGYFAHFALGHKSRRPFEAPLEILSALLRQVLSEKVEVVHAFYSNLRSRLGIQCCNFQRLAATLPELKTIIEIDRTHTQRKSQRELLQGEDDNASQASSSVAGFDSMALDLFDGASQSSRTSSQQYVRQPPTGSDSTSFADDDMFKNSTGNKMMFVSFIVTTLRVLSEMFIITAVLGDMHHADDETVELVLNIIHSKVDMVLIITHREPEPLPSQYQDFLESDYPRLTKIMLRALSRQSFEEFVSLTLHRDPSQITDLVNFLYEKIKGNPFYLREFLTLLYNNKSIRFDWRQSKWVYDNIDKLNDLYKSFTAHTEIDQSFILRRLREFPKRTKNFLIWAAFLGSPFSFDLVRQFMSLPEGLSSSDSNEIPAIDNTAITLIDSDDKALSSLQTLLQAGIIMQDIDANHFRFVHERFSRAALRLVRSENVATMNLLIAQVLMKMEDHDSYQVCEHLLAAVPLIQDKEYRSPYRREFLQAAKMASENGSFAKAAEIYNVGISLLQTNRWDLQQPDVDYCETFQFYIRLSEVYIWQGKAQEALVTLEEAYQNALEKEHKGLCHLLRNRVYFLMGDYRKVGEAMKVAADDLELCAQLRLDEFTAPDRFWEFYDMIKNATEEQLISPKPIEDPIIELVEQLMAESLTAAYLGAPDKMFQIVLLFFYMQTNIGADDNIALAYIYLAMIAVARFRLYHFAAKLRPIVLKLISECRDSGAIARASFAFAIYLSHLGGPPGDAIGFTNAAISHAITAGDRVAMLQLQSLSVRIKFFSGDDLRSILSQCDSTLASAEVLYEYSDPIIIIRAVRQAIQALTGRTVSHDADKLLTDEQHDAVAYLDQLLAMPFVASTAVYIEYYMIALFFFGHYDKIYEISSNIPRHALWAFTRATLYARFVLSIAMVQILRRGGVDLEKREMMLARIHEHQYTCQEMMSVSKSSLYTCWGIVDMELEDFAGHFDKAMVRYEDVLRHCEETNFKLDKAILHRLAGEMCMRRGIKSIAEVLLKKAAAVFMDFGAVAVVEEMSRRYADVFNETDNRRYRSVGVQTDAAQMQTEVSTDHAPADGAGLQSTSYMQAVIATAPLRPQNLKEQNDEYRTSTDAHSVERWHEDYETGMRDNTTKSESIHTLDILDLTSIIKSSQIISSEINVDTLLKKMIEIFINTTRAEIAAVIVHEDSKFRVAAMGTMNSVESFKYPHMSLESLENTVFSEPISYALNTSETVVISNTAEDERFLGASLRWQKGHADGRSILVHPVRHKNIVLGALYLEGAPHSFNTRHIEVLALLSQQMGISITNAMLFKNIRKATMANAMMIESQNAALKAARESEARFVATLETMPCIIWTADPPSASAPIDKAPPLDYLNNFWYIFCGSDAPGPANDAYLLQFHEDDREVFVGALINAKCGTYETIEVRIRDAMGNYRWHICRCTALKSDESVITKWIGALINIDDQRRAQEEALNAMRLKEEASRMKSEFLANMSHEIRTPIAGVIGMSDLLLGTDLQPEQRNFADNIRLCADALLTVITDVLDFSKIEVGKLELSNVPFDVTCVLKETLKILSFPIAKKGLRLIDDIHFSLEPMPLVMGDPGRFRQIAMNLLTNAVKFTSSGHITLTARDGYETDDIIEVKVQISDTGIGISKAVMSKLFLPFEQGDNSTARQFGGTGLGLSISKNLVELMNGTIGLESEHGKGTTAHFTVPFVKAPVDVQQSSYIDEASSLVAWDAGPKSYPHLVDVPSPVSVVSLPEVAEGYTQESLPSLEALGNKPPCPERNSTSESSVSSISAPSSDSEMLGLQPPEPKYIWILVVEDNLVNQQIALNILKKLKYGVEAVCNGQEALEALDRRLAWGQPFDLVLMDCQMPLMDGYDATRRLRRHGHCKIRDVPVIAMTANAVTGDRERCLDAGMSDYLAKPVKRNVLETIIAKWLKSDAAT